MISDGANKHITFENLSSAIAAGISPATFNLYSDVTDQATLAADDRLLFADVSNGGEPNRYTTGAALKTFVTADLPDPPEVTRLSTTRSADTSNISNNVTTTLGTLNINRAGAWMFQAIVHSVDQTSQTVQIRPRITIDGVLVLDEETVTYQTGEIFCRRVSLLAIKSNGDSVDLTCQIARPHRYGAVTFEAFYLGAAA